MINVLLATRTVPSVVAKDTFKLSAVAVMEVLEVDPDQEDVVALHKQVQPTMGLDQELDAPQ